ncbi:TniB family NTP-binding protein [Rhizobium leguminosarum]
MTTQLDTTTPPVSIEATFDTDETDQATTTIDDTTPQFHDAARVLLATMSPERRQRAERRGKAQAKYVKMPKDKLITEALDALCENAAAAFFGEAGKRRALFLLGESDSGKTRAMEYHIPKRQEFLPYVTEAGEEFRPFVSFEAPRPITLKGFARKALAACGYPIATNKLTEQELFELLKQVIRNNRILFMYVDEMQHVLKGTTTKEIQNVSDIIKSLLQIPGWPLHMIFSGVPSLARFLSPEDGDTQLRNRSIVVELKQMTRKDAKALLTLQQQVMAGDGVAVEETGTVEFMTRLIHACNGACGTIIQTMQEAAERAMTDHLAQVALPDGDHAVPTVTIRHYADVYTLNTGCRSSDNVFLQDDWEKIEPRHSLGIVLSKATPAGTPDKFKKKEG